MRTVRDRPTLLQRFPNGVAGSSFFQKRIPDSAPEWLQTTIVTHPERHDVAGDRDGRHRPRAVGRQPGLPRLPPVAVPGRRPGGHRRAAHRPRPVARRRRSRWCRRPRPRCDVCSATHGITLVPQDHRQPRPARVRARRAGVGLVRHAPGGRRRRPGARRAAARPDHRRVVEGGARGHGCSSTSTRTRRTRPCSGRGACGPAPAPRCRRRSLGRAAGDPSRRADDGDRAGRGSPRDGDPWATIDDEPQSIEPLVERYSADLAAGIPDAPWPPVYPKMPDEARRVQPEPGPQTGLATRPSASVSGNTTPDVVFPDTEPGRRHAGTSGVSGSARAIRARPASTIAAPSQPAGSRRSSSTTMAAMAAVTGSASVSVTAVEVASVRRP